MSKKKKDEKEDIKEKEGEFSEEIPESSPEDPLPEAPTTPPENSEKEELLALYKTLKDLGINSISDLEVKISRL